MVPTVLGVGRVTGPYAFDATAGFPHQRSVEWLELGQWHLPTTEGLRTTVHEYRHNTDNLVAIEARVLDAAPTAVKPVVVARSLQAPRRNRQPNGFLVEWSDASKTC